METFEKKRLLYKSKVEYMDGPGVYTMNHVQGCAHGCRYPCYAYLAAKRFGTASSEGEWMTPRPVDDVIGKLVRELDAKRKEPVERVHMCFTTDPLPWSVGCSNRRTMELIHADTLRAVGELNARGIPVTMLTKGTLPRIERDFCEGDDFTILRASSGVAASMYSQELHPDNLFGISLVTPCDEFRSAWEPGAAPVEFRVRSLRIMHEEGCRTWVSMEPFPTPAIQLETCGQTWDAAEVLSLVPFVDRVVFGRWNYGPKVTAEDREWYLRQAEAVRKWCKRWGAECHIKKGTE